MEAARRKKTREENLVYLWSNLCFYNPPLAKVLYPWAAIVQ